MYVPLVITTLPCVWQAYKTLISFDRVFGRRVRFWHLFDTVKRNVKHLICRNICCELYGFKLRLYTIRIDIWIKFFFHYDMKSRRKILYFVWNRFLFMIYFWLSLFARQFFFFFFLSFYADPFERLRFDKEKMKLTMTQHRWLHVPGRLSRSPVRFGAVRSLFWPQFST